MSDFEQLSASDGTIFLVRWRGRQEGPYAGPAMAAKLAANEIGLLHEVYYEGKWMTIRDYLALREAALGLETRAPETREYQPREEGTVRLRDKEIPPPIPMPAEDDEANDELLAARILGQSQAPSRLMDPAGRPNTRIGWRIGAVGTILWIIITVAYFLFR